MSSFVVNMDPYQPLESPPSSYKFKSRIAKENPHEQHRRENIHKQLLKDNREKRVRGTRRKQPRSAEEMQRFFITSLLRARPDSWDDQEKRLHTPLGGLDLTNKQYSTLHRLWAKFVWQKVPLATNVDDFTQKLNKLSSSEHDADSVFRNYMREVHDSNANDYFHNLDTNESAAEQLSKREPTEGDLKKLRRQDFDGSISNTETLTSNDIDKWVDKNGEIFDRAEHKFDHELAAHSEDPRAEKLYQETLQDRDRLKEELSAARVSLRTQARGLEENTATEAKLKRVEAQLEKQKAESQQLDKVHKSAQAQAHAERLAHEESQKAGQETLRHTIEEADRNKTKALAEMHTAATSEHHRLMDEKQQSAERAITDQEAQKNAALGALQVTHQAAASTHKELVRQGEQSLQDQFNAAKAEHERLTREKETQYQREIQALSEQARQRELDNEKRLATAFQQGAQHEKKLAAAGPPPPPPPPPSSQYDDAPLREELTRMRAELGGLKNAGEIQSLRHELSTYAAGLRTEQHSVHKFHEDQLKALQDTILAAVREQPAKKDKSKRIPTPPPDEPPPRGTTSKR